MKIISIIILLLSVSIHPTRFDGDPDVEHEIINAVFLDIIGKEPLGLFPPPPPPVPGATKRDSANHKKYLKQFAKRKEEFISRRKFVFMNDSLINFKNNRSAERLRKGLQEDSEFGSLVTSLISVDRDEKALNLSLIKNRGAYEFEYISNKDKVKGEFETIAQIHISRMAINDRADKACFYMSYYCGRLCGFGIIVYVSKIDDTWKIVKEDELWVS
ncbi:hypothetical protein [Prolixibacter bellariivorans]|nr:hypothetical protein [Prolixibacter bellariivorans]